ncbi:NAD(P)/FAD-dependent oxidoreductase [Uliginosibacterium sp. H3]|uniref:NADH:ubiquinone reductase (non-electrogenic) n=1 Tax=Uliginosibacterium silvisoli TaxID=3114758 RepID=A0ABU6K9A2_9RHOO|nr:NAD(P)/FAD-dependent oxidoreductase [Uliginosibacterium sp. H3]
MVQARPRVIIIGAGFGGLSAAKALADAAVDITLIDQRNHHLFQPLLYQVATASLSPADIAAPIRSVVWDQKNLTVVLGKVSGVDTEAKTVSGDNGVRSGALPYDYLIIATGARHAYFGNDHWETFAPGLKTIEDATAIRHRLLMAFEQAEMAIDAAETERLLSIVIIGGGPTGVELAGSIAELARAALARDFRRIDPRKAKVILVEAGARLLATFPEDLSAAALKSLQRLGVEVRLNARVSDCNAQGVKIGDDFVGAGTILWAAGVQASPAASWLKVEADRAGRVKVAADYSIPGHPDVFVVGDTAALTDARGVVVPGVGPAAKQAGKYAARVIMARLHGEVAPAAFVYRNYGNLATIGRRAAVVDFNWIKLRGPLAWWLWGGAHIFFLIDFRNRVAVAINWLWSFLTYKRGARLITGPTITQPREADTERKGMSQE